MTSESKRTKTLFVSCLLLFLITLFLTLFAVVSHFSERNRKVEEGRENAKKEAERASKEIENKLKEFQKIADNIANDLTQKPNSIKLKEEEIHKKIEIYWDQYPELGLYEIGFAFTPNSYDSSTRLYGEALRKDGGIIEWIDLDAKYDYHNDDNAETRWYHQAISKAKGDWEENLFLSKDKRLMATYSVPFYKYYYSESKEGETKEKAGAAYLRYPIENYEELFHSLNLGENGYAFLLSRFSEKAVFIWHPSQEYGREPKDPQLALLCQKAVSGNKEMEGNFRDTITNQSSWVFFKPIPSRQWMLGTVVMDSDFISLESSRRSLINIGILIALSLTFLIALFLKVYRGGSREIWILSSCVSFFCVVIVIQMLYLHWHSPGSEWEDINKINNQYLLKKFQKDTRESMFKEQGVLPIYVPTGFYVQSVSFYQEEVQLTGFIWQKYVGISDEVEKGVIIMGDETKELGEVFKKTTGKEELIRWKFSVVLHKEFDYAHYPFRWENIRIQLRQKTLQENIIPVPDLDAYTITNPAVKPGLPEQSVPPGWKVDRAFFSRGRHAPMTNFGLGVNPGGIQLPELNFNILMKKEFIVAAFSRMLPIFFIIVILFILLLLSPGLEQKSEANGLSVMNILVACFAIFLVVILSHTSLRDTFLDKGATYLDYFYFIVYISIFAVIVNAFLVKHARINFIQYRQNFIPKILFWPVCTFMIMLVTLILFY